MEVLVPLALLIVGLIIGFFVGRFFQSKQGESTAVSTEKQVKEILSQQAQHHIHQSRQALSSIESQCSALRQQIEDYEGLLSKSPEDESTAIPYFGEQTTTYLRNNISSGEKSKPKQVSEAQPKDFANSSSGLFVGGSEQSTEEKSQ